MPLVSVRFPLTLPSMTDPRIGCSHNGFHHFLFPKSSRGSLSTRLALLWGWPCWLLPERGPVSFSSKGALDIAKEASRASCMHFSPILKLPSINARTHSERLQNANSGHMEIFSPNYFNNLLCTIYWGNFIFISQWQGRQICRVSCDLFFKKL